MEKKSDRLTLLKILLVVQFIAIIVYTYFTIKLQGWNFIGLALEYLQSMEWKGQFSLDFFCYLLLSALWVAWRGKFSFQSILIGMLAFVGGILFFAPYVLYLINTSGGDVKKILLGQT